MRNYDIEFDMDAPFDAPIRHRKAEETRRSEEARRSFTEWCESDEGRRTIREAYERAVAALGREDA